MGGIFGGSSSSSSKSKQYTTVHNTSHIGVDIDMHLDELGRSLENINDKTLSQNEKFMKYAISMNLAELSQEEKQQQLEAYKLQQADTALQLSKSNADITIIFGVITVIIALYQIFKKKGK